MSGSPEINLEQALSEKLTIHKNLDQDVIVTTEDKVKICLIENQNIMASKKEWIAPLGIFISTTATISTANFKSVFGISPDVLKAIFIIVLISSFIWLIKALISLGINWKKGSLQYIINSLKKNSKNN